MNRTWALKQLEKYAWDTSDLSRKEITRYMSMPGQANAYMIGRLEILKSRRKAEKELGTLFNLKDFHFQVTLFLFSSQKQSLGDLEWVPTQNRFCEAPGRLLEDLWCPMSLSLPTHPSEIKVVIKEAYTIYSWIYDNPSGLRKWK